MKPKQIKELRKSLGYTQTEFAKEMRVSFATVNRWERGHTVPLGDRMAKLKEWLTDTRRQKMLEESPEKMTSCGYTVARGKHGVEVTKVDFQGFRVVMQFTEDDLTLLTKVLKGKS